MRTIMTIVGMFKARKILKKYHCNPFKTEFGVIQNMPDEDKIEFVACFHPKMRWELCRKMWYSTDKIPVHAIIDKVKEKEGPNHRASVIEVPFPTTPPGEFR